MQDDETHKNIPQECVCSSDQGLCAARAFDQLPRWLLKATAFPMGCTHLRKLDIQLC